MGLWRSWVGKLVESPMVDFALIPEKSVKWGVAANRVKEAYRNRMWALVIASGGIKGYGSPKDELCYSRLDGIGNELAQYIEEVADLRLGL